MSVRDFRRELQAFAIGNNDELRYFSPHSGLNTLEHQTRMGQQIIVLRGGGFSGCTAQERFMTF